MTLPRQFQASLLFYEKILSVSKRKSNQNQPTKAQAANKKQQRENLGDLERGGKSVILRTDVFCTLKIFS